MPKGSKTTLFISSTCYDLSQVRSDLKEFIESIGMEPILSELDSFPVDPFQDNFNNCLETVKNRTDIFILIVGGRYGSITDAGKSITNLEYLEAKAKGMPKYVFVKEDIITLLPIWKTNPDADYRAVVDTPLLFDFIVNLRDSGETWVFPFSNSQSIISTLKKQISYLFSDCLDLRAKANKSDPLVSSLGPKAFRLAVEKPKGWEWLLFAQVLADKISSLTSKRLDVELGISFGEPIPLGEFHEVTSWVSSRFSFICTTTQQLSKALNTGLTKAVGEPGETGDLQRIVHLATRISDGYEQFLDWKLIFNRISCAEEFTTLINLASEFSSNAIREIEEFSASLYSTLEEHIKNNYKEETVVKITLTLTIPDSEPFLNELNRIGSVYGLELDID